MTYLNQQTGALYTEKRGKYLLYFQEPQLGGGIGAV